MLHRKSLVLAALLQAAALPVTDAGAGSVGVDLNIRLGNPAPVIVTQPAPVIVTAPPPAPVYVPPQQYFDEVEEEVEFVYPERLGFYVAVGVPYDLFYVNSRYYVIRDGRWYWSPSSRGGWTPVGYRELPTPLRRHRLERIREYRAREWDVYRRDRDHYRGRRHSDKGYWKAERKAEHRAEMEERREEKRFEKEQRREEKRFEKEQRREEKRHEKEMRHRERDRDRD